MTHREQRAFCFSAAAHVACLFTIAVVGLLTNCTEEPEKIHVFELVSAVAPPAEIVTPPKPVPPTPPPISPKPKPPQPPKVTPKPKRPTPKVTPKPQRPKPKPKPRPKTTPRKVESAKPKLKPVSYKDFQRKHKLPERKPHPTPQPAPPRPQVRINPKAFTIPHIKLTNPKVTPTSVDPNVLNRYLAKVKASLEATWQQLQAQANLTVGGEAKVQFRISATGIILSPRIVHRSGNQALDKLVLQAFRSVGNVGRPPNGALESPLALPFRVN